MIHMGFIKRQIRRSSRQSIVFCLCVGLSLTTLTAFTGFSRSVNRALMNDARELHAADIIVRSNQPLSNPLEQAIDAWVDRGRVVRSRYHEFYSVVRNTDENRSLLSLLKVVEPGYPYYGEVTLDSGRSFGDVLKKGRVVVEKMLLERMGIGVGDLLKIGYTTLVVADTVISEPDRPLNMFSLGPRIFVSSDDLEELGLLQTGSRVRHVSLLKVFSEADLDPAADELRKAAKVDDERVETYKTANSRVKRFFDNFVFFLKLIGIFILVIAGAGVQGTLNALLMEKRYTIAIMKTVGATSRMISLHFILLVFVLGTIGTVLGILAGLAVQLGLARLLAAFFPPDMQFSIAWSGLLESLGLGFAVVAVFSFLPLQRLKDLRPIMIFRSEMGQRRETWPVYLFGAAFALFFFGLVVWHMRDIRFGLYFMLGTFSLIIIVSIVTHVLLKVMNRLTIRRLAIRQAVRGLFRKGNATHATMVTLTASLTVIFSIVLVERNLESVFIRSYPENAPNLFVLDIQPSQVEPFSRLIGGTPAFYPVIRARVTAVNDRAIDRDAERRKRGDNFARVFNLTYRHALLEDEVLIAGEGLFSDKWSGPQVSILDDVVAIHPIKIGDTIQFKIQGVPMAARVSSIRSRTKESLSPFFYFVFQEEVLKAAPQTIFTALNVSEEQIGATQNKIVSTFPNIGVIDVSGAIRVFAGLTKQLSTIVRGFSMLSIAAGVLIMVSAIYATRAERVLESVYYKILGARQLFVVKVFSTELILTGLVSGLLAMLVAEVGAYLICHFYLEIPYAAYLPTMALMVVMTLCTVLAVGIVSAQSILAKKPISFLREQHNG